MEGQSEVRSEITRKLWTLAEAGRRFAASLGSVDLSVTAYPIEEQFFLLRLRERLLREYVVRPAREVADSDGIAAQHLYQYLAALGSGAAVTGIEEDITQALEALTQLPATRSGVARAPDVAFEILTEVGGPMHFRELATLVSARGARLGGVDSAETLRAYLQRDRRFRRVPAAKGRGIYEVVPEKATAAQPDTAEEHGDQGGDPGVLGS